MDGGGIEKPAVQQCNVSDRAHKHAHCCLYVVYTTAKKSPRGKKKTPAAPRALIHHDSSMLSTPQDVACGLEVRMYLVVFHGRSGLLLLRRHGAQKG